MQITIGCQNAPQKNSHSEKYFPSYFAFTQRQQKRQAKSCRHQRRAVVQSQTVSKCRRAKISFLARRKKPSRQKAKCESKQQQTQRLRIRNDRLAPDTTVKPEGQPSDATTNQAQRLYFARMEVFKAGNVFRC